eukprot:Nitzschia sp. Nitz4//scaffold57_size113557//40309//40938//NITZ4_003988-RA/size113557-processed-gene-0.31-mRNA-1//-1//CDS//3329554837//4578//frame0
MSTTTTSSNPFPKLIEDWQAARGVKDPNAPFCTLMTIDESGFPTGRVLGLREIDDKGNMLVYINDTSPKWNQLLANSKYEILLFWTSPNMMQYRIRGSQWKAMDDDIIQQRWQEKPKPAKVLDYYYSTKIPQSQVLPGGRAQFVEEMTDLRAAFADESKEVPFQSIAKGLILQPNVVEEWRNSLEDRLHHRYLHKKVSEDEWETQALVP